MKVKSAYPRAGHPATSRHVILTPEQKRLIDESTGPVQIVGRQGQVWVTARSLVTEDEIAESCRVAADFDDLSEAEHGLLDCDLDRIAEQSRNFKPTGTTLSDLLSELQSKYPMSTLQ